MRAEGNWMLIIFWGLRVVYRTVAQGRFYCRRCGGDRRFRMRAGRRFITVFFIPVIPLNKTGEHVQCVTCRTRYVTDVLNAPTASQMQAAIPAGVRAMAILMLVASGVENPAARKRAIGVARGAGEGDCDEDDLLADLPQPLEQARAAVARLGAQLRPEAREWHLAEAIRIALADGPLSPAERVTAETIAADLGLTKAQSFGVIALTEQAAGR